MSFRRGATTATGVLSAVFLFPVIVLTVVCGGFILAMSVLGMAAGPDTEPAPAPPVASVSAPVSVVASPGPAADVDRAAALAVAGSVCVGGGGTWSVPAWALRPGETSYNALWCAGPPSARTAATAAWEQW